MKVAAKSLFLSLKAATFALLFLGQLAYSQPIKAVLFDVFGTCVELRGSLIEQGRQWSQANALAIDWPTFVDAWLLDHALTIQAVRTGKSPWITVDAIHENTVRNYFSLPEYQVKTLSHFWHQLKPWPDTSKGLSAIKKHFQIGALSNGNETLLQDLALNANLPWDFILSSEKSLHYKPDPEAYQSASETLNLKPEEILLVASHPYDLRAAKALGWKTALVIRPGESEGYTLKQAKREFDFAVLDFVELSKQLEVP